MRENRPSPIIHCVQKSVPYICLYVCPHVLVEATPWTTLMIPYLYSLAHSHVVTKAMFMLALHVVNNREVACCHPIL